MPFLCRAVEAFEAIKRTGNLMVGVPDYETYVRHRQAEHPDEPPMDLAAFHRNSLERRYGGGPNRISRCC